MNDDISKRDIVTTEPVSSNLFKVCMLSVGIIVLGLSFHGRANLTRKTTCGISFSDSSAVSFIPNLATSIYRLPPAVIPLSLEMKQRNAASSLPLPPPPMPEMPIKPITKLAGGYTEMVKIAARKNAIPARLIASVLYVETRARPGDVVSHAGAIGPMQLMPHTAWVVLKINPWRPMENINGATRYIKRLIGRFGSIKQALIAYNEGPTKVDQGHIDTSARHYAETVLRLARLSPNQKSSLINNISYQVQLADAQ